MSQIPATVVVLPSSLHGKWPMLVSDLDVGFHRVRGGWLIERGGVSKVDWSGLIRSSLIEGVFQGSEEWVFDH